MSWTLTITHNEHLQIIVDFSGVKGNLLGYGTGYWNWWIMTPNHTQDSISIPLVFDTFFKKQFFLIYSQILFA